jgi:aminopeptidase
MNKTRLNHYAQLAMEVGLQVKEGDIVSIRCPVEAQAFGRAAVQAAYEAGAKEVDINWGDDFVTRQRFENEALDHFTRFPEWQKVKFTDLAERGAKFLAISSADPDLLDGIDSQKIIANQKSTAKGLEAYRKKMMNDEVSWCVISVPTGKWAQKIFPDQTEEEAVESLWDRIFAATRMHETDPIAAWKAHLDDLQKRQDFLQKHDFEKLHFTSDKGTDLEILLPEGHVWTSGGSKNAKGEPFVANLPTEEVFTLPHKTGVNGVVYSTKPLNYGGQLIDDFRLVLKDGRVEEYQAAQGEKALTELFSVDEGSRYLGEVALVPYHSPISDTGIIFYNTLFDENAACHLAFGEAYPTSLSGGEKMTEEELQEKGVNRSLSHVDFMIGDATLSITGITKDGKEVPVFEKGNWAFS